MDIEKNQSRLTSNMVRLFNLTNWNGRPVKCHRPSPLKLFPPLKHRIRNKMMMMIIIIVSPKMIILVLSPVTLVHEEIVGPIVMWHS